jgi:hypothetical protein
MRSGRCFLKPQNLNPKPGVVEGFCTFDSLNPKP